MNLKLYVFVILCLVSVPLLSQSESTVSSAKRYQLLKQVQRQEILSRGDLMKLYNYYADDKMDSLHYFAEEISKTGLKTKNKLYLNIGKAFLGAYFGSKQNTNLSMQLSRSALSYFESISDYEMMVFLNNQIGTTFVRENNFREAHHAFKIALRYASNTGNYVLNLYPLKNQAEAYYRQKEYQRAIANADTLIKYVSPKTQYASLCSAYLIKGKALMALEKNTEAEKYFDKAYQLEKKYPSSFFKGNLLTDLAMLYFEKNADRAKYYFEEALAVNRETNLVEPICASYYNLGMWYWAVDKEDSALTYFQQSFAFAKERLYEQGELDALGILSDFYANQENHQKAYEMLAQYRELSESRIFQENQRDRNDMIDAFDLMNAESKLFFADDSQSLYNRIYRSENRTKMVTTLALSVALVFLVFYFIRSRTKRSRMDEVDNEYL